MARTRTAQRTLQSVEAVRSVQRYARRLQAVVQRVQQLLPTMPAGMTQEQSMALGQLVGGAIVICTAAAELHVPDEVL